ncbi:cytochrome b/b6 domain-containing protein [Rhodovulum adriaticum]|uniref:Cytochrome b n=1 Tax=Rhodovulum adriaticum TaxID=35804 RepID=A0A4R2NNG0_RHOAD|nr:cytochrome b/b6 domain-containing protein [Rhodovulum adriaticum]TCP23051.1 cytochrome b [Rhodovulum adriaticum]
MTEAEIEKTIQVWDPIVRIGHWVLVAGFAIAYLTEGEPEAIHSFAGYAICVVVGLRLVWGVIGPRRARFSDFVTGPTRAIAYLKGLFSGTAERHVGHSPAGAAMVVALLIALSVTGYSGMATLAQEEGRGPLAGSIPQLSERGAAAWGDEDAREHHEGEHGEGAWEEIHETAANLTLLLILLHVGGVLLASVVHRENLTRAMVNGRKRAD